ncbi:N-acetylmuramoyl-L-alanine amidase family protein [Enterocloster citroniae]|uniref:N-acetylmuramoyl-L-alanine amidase family protein n=1 Tax=Enterocloster citroniae TaxID=358743 RepID=UPI00349E9EE8
MTVKRLIWGITAGLWMASIAAGTAMGEEAVPAGKGPVSGTAAPGVRKEETKEIGPADGTVAAGVKKADSGWVEENGTMRYTDSKGNYVTNDWKTRDGVSYYLGSEGTVEKNTWIANTYYVDGEGAMVRNSWIHTDGKDGLKEAGWYFLGRDGKAEEDGWKNIEDGRYCFDSDGRMRTGWYYEGNNIYYLGDKDDGAMRRGWQCLEFDEDQLPREGDSSKEYKKAGENARWFYFQSNGKAKRSTSKEYNPATIDGKKYYFDENGVMLTGWHAVKSSAQSGDAVGISRFIYLGGPDEGYMTKGQWKQLSEHPGNSSDQTVLKELDSGKGPKEGDKEWYYFENDGTPAYLKTTATTMNGAITKVNGESYFLDQYGCRQTGLVRVISGNLVLNGYFGDKDSDGRMRTGRIDGVEDGSGEMQTFYFATSGSAKGSGYTGEKDGFLYSEGLLVKAGDDMDYQAFQVDGKIYLVNAAGKIQTNEKAYKVDDQYTYRVDSGTVYSADSSGNKGKRLEKGEKLPEFKCEKEYKLK